MFTCLPGSDRVLQHVMLLTPLTLLSAVPAARGAGFGFPTTIGGAISNWVLEAGVEMEARAARETYLERC